MVETHLRICALSLQLFLRKGAELAAAAGLTALQDGLLAVLGPEMVLSQPGPPATAGSLVFGDDGLPVGLHMFALAFGLRVEPVPQRILIKLVRKRPTGQPGRLCPFQYVRYRTGAHADRGGDIISCQTKLVTLAKDVLDVDHVGFPHAHASSFRLSDR